MTLRRLVAASAVLAASVASAHGPTQGALVPHVHPHAAEPLTGLEIGAIASIAVAVAAALFFGVRALARRR